MDHNEALQEMATERYLLGELTPELREAFEAHVFACSECALDVRAAAAFIEEAKLQLPHLTPPATAGTALPRAADTNVPPLQRAQSWFACLRPTFAVPVFALLLGVAAYQNLATIPELRLAARQPRLAPWTTLHVGTRGSARVPLVADRNRGAVLLIDLPPGGGYDGFTFELDRTQGKPFWTQSMPASPGGTDEVAPVSLFIPGRGLQQGSYALTVSGVTADGQRTQLDRRILDIQFNR
jgi:hypothetical protein